MPIYPEQNSFDVFKYGDNFLLDNKTKRPLVYGGVPADDFNALGQNWHTCVYDWKKLKQTNFEFLTKKITILMDLYHCLRLDHFIGYVKCYQIDAKHEQKAKWVDAGGEDCIKTIVNKFGKNSFVVEDLGLKIPEVQEVKQKYGLTGMKVMQFELDKCPNEYCYEDKNNITYLGTHDNNTFIGYLNRLGLEQKKQIAKSLGKRYYTDEKLTLEILQKLLSYKNNKVIVGVQDLLLQGEEFRTNVPGKAQGCWEYRLPENYKTKIKQTLKIITGEK